MLLLQILDSELFELMHQNGDYTHFYFCYRWFLLDFKRGMTRFYEYSKIAKASAHFLLVCIYVCMYVCLLEMLYEDVFAVWEVIWVAPRISSQHFVLFIALALVAVYREIICDNNMDFTDIIKFFNGKGISVCLYLKDQSQIPWGTRWCICMFLSFMYLHVFF